jgi:ring-1,2-phenylacetyl-CoA epoxidase subunit PaaA
MWRQGGGVRAAHPRTVILLGLSMSGVVSVPGPQPPAVAYLSAMAPNPISDDPARVSAFEARVAAGESIEPKDWMPERYRRQLVRMMSQHAHSEVVGMLPEGNWITRAPSLRRKMSLLAKVQDEAGHGLYIYCGTETLGVDRQELIQQLLEGTAKYSSIFNYPTLTWADIGAIGWLVDGAAIVNQTMLAKASYGPYARAMVRICKEENFHKRQGYEIMATLAAGTVAQKAMAQDALNRWWWPSLMMFGPHDSESTNSDELMRWGVKRKSNDELRQRFINQTIAQAKAIDLEIPDSQLRYDEAKQNWLIGPIDWDEFWRVVRGNGPCNRERLAARRAAHDDGEWVRVAASAYAAKQAAAASSEAA